MFIDANIFGFALVEMTPKGEACRDLLDSVVRGRKAVTSCLVIDELMWALIRNGQAQHVENAVKNIYEMSNLEIVAPPSNAPLTAIQFMKEYNLKPRDAMHLATMQHYGITMIASDDKDFDRIKGIKRIAPKNK